VPARCGPRERSPYLVLAELSVPRVGTPIPAPADTRKFTAALNGILPVRNDTDQPPPGQAYGSQFIYRLDTGVLMVRKGSSWAPYRPPRGDTWHEPTLTNFWANWGDDHITTAYTLMDGRLGAAAWPGQGRRQQQAHVHPAGGVPADRTVAVRTAQLPPSPDLGARIDVFTDGTVVP